MLCGAFKRSGTILNDVDEAGRFAAMLRRSAALKLALAEEAAPALAVVGACERTIRAGGKNHVLRQRRLGRGCPAPGGGVGGPLRGSVVRNSWPALALTLDPTTMSAAGNDFGFEEVFARPLRGLGKAGDVLFGITTSGRSANVLNALRAAREMGIVTVGLLGGDGGPALPLCDFTLLVPDTETARIQECHITLGHAVLTLLEDRLVE